MKSRKKYYRLTKKGLEQLRKAKLFLGGIYDFL